MSRFSYGEIDNLESLLAYGRWEGRSKKVMNGRPALASFRELETALLALPSKRLIDNDICDGEDVCAIGALVFHKETQSGKDGLELLDSLADDWFGCTTPSDTAALGADYGMTETLAWIISEENDEGHYSTPEQRYTGILAWTRKHIARLEAKFAAK